MKTLIESQKEMRLRQESHRPQLMPRNESAALSRYLGTARTHLERVFEIIERYPHDDDFALGVGPIRFLILRLIEFHQSLPFQSSYGRRAREESLERMESAVLLDDLEGLS